MATPNATAVKFGHPASLIREYRHWLVLARPQQVTLGALVLACTDAARAFSQISVRAFEELAQVTADLDAALTRAFKPDKLNYLMLMMVDPDVHFHVIPRYAGSRNFGALAFADAGWPGPPALEPAVALDTATIDSLVARLRAAWQAAPGP
jgi:diadenosine tetraphosphate (Ap4A) HIT family hydrolase